MIIKKHHISFAWGIMLGSFLGSFMVGTLVDAKESGDLSWYLPIFIGIMVIVYYVVFIGKDYILKPIDNQDTTE